MTQQVPLEYSRVLGRAISDLFCSQWDSRVIERSIRVLKSTFRAISGVGLELIQLWSWNPSL